jgi:hypothetical protein
VAAAGGRVEGVAVSLRGRTNRSLNTARRIRNEYQRIAWLTFCALTLLATVPTLRAGEWLDAWQATNHVWRGVHLWLEKDSDAQALIGALPKLAAAGANAVVIEVNYSFEFQAHPELRNRTFITKARAHELAQTARRCGIRLIPEFNCLGHQTFGRRAEPLLAKHPEFNETPSLTPTNAGVYCLSWCPRAQGLNEIIFSLIDDLAEGFEADAFHVGLDEVYLIASDECPRCRGASPAGIFAQQVNDLHQHIVRKRKLEMLMWADRVIGPKYQGVSPYDNARNDLSAAVDLIPKDIIQCDWHYEKRTNYASVPFLTEKGFRVWPAGFQPLEASRAFSNFAREQKNLLVLGFLCTTWNETKIAEAAEWPPIREILANWKAQ